MPKPTLDTSLTWEEHLATVNGDTTRAVMFDNPKEKYPAYPPSMTEVRAGGEWGDDVDNSLRELWCAAFGRVTTDGVQAISALGTNDNIQVGHRAKLDSGSIWVCDSVTATTSLWRPESVGHINDYGFDNIEDLRTSTDNSIARVGYRLRMPSGRVWVCWATSGGNTSWVPEDNHWHMVDYGFVPDDDSEPTMTANRALWFFYRARMQDWVAANPDAAWPVMYVPPGITIAFNNVLNTLGDTVWKIHGRLLMAGSVTPTGGAFLAVDQANSVYFDGGGTGIIESTIGTGAGEGLAGNVNLIAVGNQEAILTEEVTDILITGLTFIGARHYHIGSASGDSLTLGNGGGKAIAPQNGAQNINITNCRVYDCDIGIAVEGINGDNPGQRYASANISGVTIENSRYMAMIFAGDTDFNSLDVNISGVHCINCGNGQITHNSLTINNSEQFGVITLAGAHNVSGKVKIFNETGISTLVRGNCAGMNLEIDAHVAQLEAGINYELQGGHQFGTAIRTERNYFDLKVQVDDETNLGPLLVGSDYSGTTATLPRSSYHRLTWSVFDSGINWHQTYPTTLLDLTDMGDNNNYWVLNQGGSTTLMSPAYSSLQVGDGVNWAGTSSPGLIHNTPNTGITTVQRYRVAGVDQLRDQITVGGTLQRVSQAGVTQTWQANGDTTLGFAGREVLTTGYHVYDGSTFIVTDATRDASLGPDVGSHSSYAALRWNTDDNELNIWDGTNWRDFTGLIT